MRVRLSILLLLIGSVLYLGVAQSHTQGGEPHSIKQKPAIKITKYKHVPLNPVLIAGKAVRLQKFYQDVKAASDWRFISFIAEREDERKRDEERKRNISLSAPVGSAPSADITYTETSTGVSGFLACTRAHESDTAGGYQAHSPDGLYHGAYQFLQSTWDNTARHAGRPDLAGINPGNVPAADQDTVATSLYQWQGKAPWGGRC
jgi:hypothetical protein